MLFHISSRDTVFEDDYGLYGDSATISILKLTEAYPGELANWYRKNQIDDWLKHNCSYYDKTWSDASGTHLTIEFYYVQHLNEFRKVWL